MISIVQGTRKTATVKQSTLLQHKIQKITENSLPLPQI